MNAFAVWFGRLVWLGIVANLVLAIPGLLWPEQLLAFFGFPPASPPLWPSFACLLLILLSLFYMPGAINLFHYRANAYLAVISRVAGGRLLLCRAKRLLPAWPVRSGLCHSASDSVTPSPESGQMREL
jgi:hypothetical protein